MWILRSRDPASTSPFLYTLLLHVQQGSRIYQFYNLWFVPTCTQIDLPHSSAFPGCRINADWQVIPRGCPQHFCGLDPWKYPQYPRENSTKYYNPQRQKHLLNITLLINDITSMFKSPLQKLYGRHHDLIERYKISIYGIK